MHRRLMALIIVLFIITPLGSACIRKSDPDAAIDIQIYQVLPVARSASQWVQSSGEGEAIALINAGTKPHTTLGWTIQTGSGRVALPRLTVQPGRVIYIAQDAEYFRIYWNFAPDFEYGVDSVQAVPDLKLPDQKPPVLNDQGDVVRLLDGKGKLVDILVYGQVGNPPAPWSGPPVQLVQSFPLTPGNQVITRLKQDKGLLREPKADSWSGGTPAAPRRVYYAGQSDFPVRTVTGNVTVTAASAPDNAGPLVFDLVDRARKTIRMVGYQFTNQDLADRLVAAVRRGVRVQVAIERNPGGSDMFDSDKEAHAKLTRGGVEVLYYHKFDGDLSTRFNPVHSKYAILDDDTVIVSSGNWTGGALNTLDPTCGNREWTAVLQGNPEVVKLVREVWDFDFTAGHREVRPWDEKKDLPLAPDTYDPGPCFPYTSPKPAPVSAGGTATVTRILSPDNTLDRENGFLGQLAGARQELWINANYINLWWGAASDPQNLTRYPQPYLTEIVAAARRGVDVKVLLDRRNVRADSLRDNHYVVKYLNDLAATEKLKLEARLINMDLAGIGRTYHNKSFIVDGGVVISSINGSENSFRYARELALRIDGIPEFTQYYRELFLYDWNASSRPNQPWNVMAVPRNDGTWIDWSVNVELDVVKYELLWKPSAAAEWQKVTEVIRPGVSDWREKGTWGVVAVAKSGAKSQPAEVSR